MAAKGGSDVLVKIGGDVSEFQDSLKGVLGEITQWVSTLNPVLAGVVGAVAAIGAAAVNIGLQYQEATNIIRTGTGATGDALASLRGDFEAVFKTVPEDAETVATAIADLNTRLGLTGKPLQDLTNQFLDLASATGVKVADAIRLGTRVFGDWGIEAEKQAGALDYLFKVSQSTGASFGDLAGKVVQFGAPLRQMGFSFDEAAALMGKFEKEGVNTELVMGSLRIALTKMAAGGISDTKAGLEQVMQAIKDAGSAGEANTIALETFGARAGPDMAAAIREGRFEIQGLMDDLAKSPETISAADAATETFGEKLSILWKNIQGVLEPLGTGLVDAGRAALDAINGLFSGTGELSSGVSALMDWLKPLTDVLQQYVAPAVAAVLTAFIGLESFIGQALIATLKILWNNILEPLAGFLRDVLVVTIKTVFSALDSFLSVLSKLPGVSKLFEEGQRAVNAVLGDSATKVKDASAAVTDLKAAHEAVKPATDQHTAVLVTHKAAQDAAKLAAQQHKDEQAKLKTQHDLTKAATTAHNDALKAHKAALDDATRSLKDFRQELPPATADVSDLTDALGDMGLSKVLDDLPGYLGTVEQRTQDTKNALKALGIEPKEDLQALADQAKVNFETIQSSGTASAAEIEAAHKAYLTKLVDYYKAAGIAIPPELQKQVDANKTASGQVQQAWGGALQQVSTALTDFSKGIVNDLFSGDFSVSGSLEKLGQTFTRIFMEDAMSAVNTFVEKGLKYLLSNLDDILGKIPGLGGIGSALSGVFGGGGSAAGGAASAAGGAASSAGSAGAGAASSVASTVGSTAAQWIGAIGSAVSAVTGVLSLFGVGQSGQKDRLNQISDATTFVAQMYGDRGLEAKLQNQANDIANFVNGAFGGWFHDALASLMTTQETALTTLTDRIVPALDKLSPNITVNVKVTLDSQEISSIVEQDIQFNANLALAS